MSGYERGRETHILVFVILFHFMLDEVLFIHIGYQVVYIGVDVGHVRFLDQTLVALVVLDVMV